MTNLELTLQTDGFIARWQLERSPVSDETLIGRVVIELAPEVGGAVFQSIEIGILPSDLNLLRDYLAKHITALESKTTIADYPYFGYDLGFQLQALYGELEAGKGECGLRILVNLGKSSTESRVYGGAESVVDIATLRQFISAISDLKLK